MLPEVIKFETELANKNVELKLQINNLIVLKIENTLSYAKRFYNCHFIQERSPLYLL